MKKISLILSACMLVALAMTTTSCNLFNETICTRIEGDTEAQTLELDAITSLDVRDDAQVFLKEGPVQEVRVEAQQEILDNLNFRVENGELIVDVEGCFRGDYTFDVYVTLPSAQALEDLEVSGAGSLQTNTAMTVSDDVDFDISGSGSIDFTAANATSSVEISNSGSGEANIEIGTNTMDIGISGSGRIMLIGASVDTEVSITGSGILQAYEFVTKNANVSVSGSGNAEMRVEGGALDVRISGSGTVRYKGQPGSIEESISGSGRLIDEN
ncbi:MAG: head GIN domain-containing protein [Bacteroidota bacterium]